MQEETYKVLLADAQFLIRFALKELLKETNTQVKTDSLGRYVFSNICPGKYTLLCATISGFKPINKVNILRTKIVVPKFKS